MSQNNTEGPNNIAGIVLGTVGAVFVLAVSYWYYETRIRPAYNRSILADDYYTHFASVQNNGIHSNTIHSEPVKNPLINNIVVNDSIEDGRMNHTMTNKPQPITRRQSHEKSGQYQVISNPLLSNLDNMLFDDLSPTNDYNDDDSEEIVQVFLEGIVKSGYMFKRSTNIQKNWLRRWFFIKEGKLYYIHNFSDIAERRDINAVLVSNLLVSTVKEVSPKEFQIISPGQRKAVTGGGIYELQTETEIEAQEWIIVIRQQILGSLTESAINNHHMNNQLDNEYYITLTQNNLAALHEKNPFCADCGVRDPEWASINLNILICIECCGIHRKLGVHISKVRSLILDKWTPGALQLLTEIGNNNSNEIWEAKNKTMIQQYKESNTITLSLREVFIIDKYINRLYLAPLFSTADADQLLLKASKNCNLIQILIALINNANINIISTIQDHLSTSLHFTVQQNHILCTELLCIWGANIDEINHVGKTPYDIAVERKYTEILQILHVYKK